MGKSANSACGAQMTLSAYTPLVIQFHPHSDENDSIVGVNGNLGAPLAISSFDAFIYTCSNLWKALDPIIYVCNLLVTLSQKIARNTIPCTAATAGTTAVSLSMSELLPFSQNLLCPSLSSAKKSKGQFCKRGASENNRCALPSQRGRSLHEYTNSALIWVSESIK